MAKKLNDKNNCSIMRVSINGGVLLVRPILAKDISLQEFGDFYWLKEELQSFCRNNGISASGAKVDISNRIKTFLQTGEIEKPSRFATSKTKSHKRDTLTLDTIITVDHRCSQEVRAFFKTAIHANFHFSTYIQNYFKTNQGKTYSDVIQAWHEEEQRKKDPSYQKEIAPQFEYNQFTRDYFADPNNRGKSREEAIEAWNAIKKLPGSNKYIPSN